MREYRRELYKREYHPRVKLFLKCVSCSVESRQTANGSLWLPLLQRPIWQPKDLNVEDGRCCIPEVESSKPEPDIFKVTLDKLGDIDPEDVIVVGDTPYDAEAAGR